MEIVKSIPNRYGWYVKAYNRKTCKDVIIENRRTDGSFAFNRGLAIIHNIEEMKMLRDFLDKTIKQFEQR